MGEPNTIDYSDPTGGQQEQPQTQAAPAPKPLATGPNTDPVVSGDISLDHTHVDVPNVGTVGFPGSMSQDHVNGAAGALYDSHVNDPAQPSDDHVNVHIPLLGDVKIPNGADVSKVADQLFEHSKKFFGKEMSPEELQRAIKADKPVTPVTGYEFNTPEELQDYVESTQKPMTSLLMHGESMHDALEGYIKERQERGEMDSLSPVQKEFVKVLEGAGLGGAAFVDSMSTPENVMTLVALAPLGSLKIVNKLIAAGFGTQMAVGSATSIVEGYKKFQDGDLKGATEAWTNALFTGAMARESTKTFEPNKLVTVPPRVTTEDVKAAREGKMQEHVNRQQAPAEAAAEEKRFQTAQEQAANTPPPDLTPEEEAASHQENLERAGVKGMTPEGSVTDLLKNVKDVNPKLVGSQATGRATPTSDIDITVDRFGDDVQAVLKQAGYDSRGSSIITPKEAASYDKPVPEGWSRVEHFENTETGKKIDIWHEANTEPEQGLTPEGANFSNEEIARQARGERYYTISKGGNITAQMSQPDAASDLKGGVVVKTLPDGTVDVQRGDSSILDKYRDRLDKATKPSKTPPSEELANQSAKAELGDNASTSDLAKRAEEVKLQNRPVYGENNKIVTTEKYESAKAAIGEQLVKLGSSQFLETPGSVFNKEMLGHVADVAMYHVEAGVRTFSEFSDRMLSEFGEAVHPFLNDLWGTVLNKEGQVSSKKDFESGKDALMRVSTRFPTGVKAEENPIKQLLSVGLESVIPKEGMSPQILKSTQKMLTNMSDAVSSHDPVSLGKVTPEQRLEHFINFSKDNLKYLYGKAPEAMRTMNKQWYDTAHGMAVDLAKKYGLTNAQAAGVIASLSPQKEWNSNLDLAKRMVDIYKTKQNFVTTPEMLEKGKQISQASTEMRKTMSKNSLEGKSLSQLTDADDRAAWVRLYDEAHNPQAYHAYSAAGVDLGVVQNKSGSPTKMAWQGPGAIKKALDILENGDRDNISRNLGFEHKVRNFYNNIIAPNHPAGDVTIDTHAVGAALMQMVSGKHVDVLNNFGAGGKSSITGVSGTYPLYAEAYRRAASELGLQPRQLQSIVWEQVRDLFPENLKNEANAKRINNIWEKYRSGELTAEKARDAVFSESNRVLDEATKPKTVTKPNKTKADFVKPAEKVLGGEPAKPKLKIPPEVNIQYPYLGGEIPEAPPLPQKGQMAAVRTTDGQIFANPDWQGQSHLSFAHRERIPADKIESGGWLRDGVYEKTSSDANGYAERARAKLRTLEQKAARKSK